MLVAPGSMQRYEPTERYGLGDTKPTQAVLEPLKYFPLQDDRPMV